MADDQQPGFDRNTLRVLAVIAFMLIVLRRAWMCDDAFISMRVVDNFVGGYGLTFNPDERVQGFTNPLWVFLVSLPHAIVEQPYWSCVGTSLVVALGGAVVLAYRVARDGAVAALALIALAFTQAFADFSTSGMENPLSHLLLIAFLAIYLMPDWRIRYAQWAWLLAGLMFVNRLDSGLLVIPALAHLWTKLSWRRSLRLALIGLSPIIAWELFSLVYYGFLLPNTALAKLNVDIPKGTMIGQGLIYLVDSLERDPLTGLLIAAGITVGWMHRDWSRRFVALGVLLQLAYVVWVAGDFMAGRFLSLPLAGAVCLLAASLPDQPDRSSLARYGAALGVVILVSPHNPFRENPRPDGVPESGVVNERDWYREHTGIVANLRQDGYKNSGWYKEGRQMADRGTVAEQHCNAGLSGIGAGPHVHILDLANLTDALLAHVEYKHWPHRKVWRVAHYGRPVPPGYLDTLRTGKNLIADPKLREYYDKLRVVIRGPLFTADRFRLIWELNTGKYSYLLE
jgi:arabinofuranosyltransferase